MAYEVRDLSGSIFKNRNMKNEKSADMTGSARIFGRDVWINAWVKTDKNGEKWISFAFKPKNPTASQVQSTSSIDLDSDAIPF